MREWLARRRDWAGKAGVVAGVLLAGLLAAGCAGHSARQARGSVQACARFSANVMQRHLTVTTLPAACGGLTRAQLGQAVNAAAGEVAATGSLHGKTLMRARKRELSPLLPRLTHLAEPRGPLPVAGTLPGGPSLGLVTLVCWLVTVGLGLYLTGRWILRGGLRRSGRRLVRSPAMNLGHLGLAVAGLLVWVGYLLTGVAALAWIACLALLPVTGLGMALLVLRLPWQSRTVAAPAPVPVPAGAATARAPAAQPLAAQPSAGGSTVRQPSFTWSSAGRRATPLIVAAHIVFAVATMMLALLAAISAG